ncbi:sugar ABC transporter substrate-binding protein [Taklimakanibacter deserti]|uniref:sugar ABC transporter substrate-binding protein n=1 Tax=Taklimakanibacter deserti TaxID=2267839 RepID=UPI000E648C4A
MNMKSLLGLAGAIAILTGASWTRAAEVSVAEFTSLDNEYWSNFDKGARQAAEALGLEYRVLTNGGDASKQIGNYEAQITAGAKMFFGNAQDVGNVKQMAEKVKAAGGTYVGIWDALPWFHPIDNGADNYAYATFFAPDGEDNAYVIAKALFEKMGKKGNLVHITGYPGSSAEISRTLGVDKALKEYPEIKLIARQPGNWNQIDSRKVMEDLIVANPQIDGVFGQNDSVGVGAMQALEDAGLKDIPVVGLDGNAETMDLIKEGRFFATMSFTPAWQAGFSLVRAYDVAHGWKPGACERMMYMGATLITAENVEAYTKFLEGDKLPFDWKKMSRTLNPDNWDPQNHVWPIDAAQMWRTAEKPAGYELPKEYTAEFGAGCVDKLKADYESHYKSRIPE